MVALRGRLARTEKKLTRARARLAEVASPPPPPPEVARHLHSLFTPTEQGRTCATCGKPHPGPCECCGGLHGRKCPRVREVEYEFHGDQPFIKRVVFWRTWDATGVMFPEDLPPLPGEEGGG